MSTLASFVELSLNQYYSGWMSGGGHEWANPSFSTNVLKVYQKLVYKTYRTFFKNLVYSFLNKFGLNEISDN